MYKYVGTGNANQESCKSHFKVLLVYVIKNKY